MTAPNRCSEMDLNQRKEAPERKTVAAFEVPLAYSCEKRTWEKG